MLKIILAGLVINKIYTLQEAEYISSVLGDKPIPKTVKEVIKEIERVRKEYRKLKRIGTEII